jgi:hypothetical protein
MENQEKLDLVLAKIKAVKGNTAAKLDRIKCYTESLESDLFNSVTLEQIENFDFEKEVKNRQIAIQLYKKSKSKVTPYSLKEFKTDLNKIKKVLASIEKN